MKEYGCLQELSLGTVCSSANNFLCDVCTEKLIRRLEQLEAAEQMRGADCSHEWDTDETGEFCIRCYERKG